MKKITGIILTVALLFITAGCDSVPATGTKADTLKTIEAANVLQENQPTPNDIDYSLERYNLIRRAYWVNGQREKARSIPCAIADIPLGYVVLFTESGSVIGKFVVEGKVSSLNSYLTPDSEYYEGDMGNYHDGDENHWLADIDGSYGTNDNGIFFFTPDGKYIEWTGIYLYSDIPFEIDESIIKVVAVNE